MTFHYCHRYSPHNSCMTYRCVTHTHTHTRTHRPARCISSRHLAQTKQATRTRAPHIARLVKSCVCAYVCVCVCAQDAATYTSVHTAIANKDFASPTKAFFCPPKEELV